MARPRIIGRRWTVKDLLTYNFDNLPSVLTGIEIDDAKSQFEEHETELYKWREKHPNLWLQIRAVPVYPPEPHDAEGLVARLEEYLKPESIVIAQGAKGEMWVLGNTSPSWLGATLTGCLSAYLAERTFGDLIQPVGVPDCEDTSAQERIRLAWHYCQMAAAAGVMLQANCWGNDEKWEAGVLGSLIPNKIEQFEFANLRDIPPAQRSLEPGRGIWQEDEDHFRRMLQQAREIEASQIVLYHYGTKLKHAHLIDEVWPEEESGPTGDIEGGDTE